MRSYRTYEEWKRTRDVRCLHDVPGSYRTYEEWKREEVAELVDGSTVLTVPMRNGNV